MSGVDELGAQISGARQRFLEATAGLLEVEARQRPVDSEWSIIEVLAHIVDVDDFYLGEALKLRDRHRQQLRYFDDDAWKQAHPAPGGFELDDVLSRLEASHKRVLAAVSALTDEELARQGVHPRGIPYTVRDILLRFPAHDVNHRQQIEAIRVQLGI